MSLKFALSAAGSNRNNRKCSMGGGGVVESNGGQEDGGGGRRLYGMYGCEYAMSQRTLQCTTHKRD